MWRRFCQRQKIWRSITSTTQLSIYYALRRTISVPRDGYCLFANIRLSARFSSLVTPVPLRINRQFDSSYPRLRADIQDSLWVEECSHGPTEATIACFALFNPIVVRQHGERLRQRRRCRDQLKCRSEVRRNSEWKMSEMYVQRPVCILQLLC